MKKCTRCEINAAFDGESNKPDDGLCMDCRHDVRHDTPPLVWQRDEIAEGLDYWGQRLLDAGFTEEDRTTLLNVVSGGNALSMLFEQGPFFEVVESERKRLRDLGLAFAMDLLEQAEKADKGRTHRHSQRKSRKGRA